MKPLAMISETGVAMLHGMTGSAGGYWSRSHGGDIIQHSFWHFDTEGTPGRWRRPSTSSATCPTRLRRSSASISARLLATLRTAAENALVCQVSGIEAVSKVS
jgi:hypothetical protein